MNQENIAISWGYGIVYIYIYAEIPNMVIWFIFPMEVICPVDITEGFLVNFKLSYNNQRPSGKATVCCGSHGPEEEMIHPLLSW